MWETIKDSTLGKAESMINSFMGKSSPEIVASSGASSYSPITKAEHTPLDIAMGKKVENPNQSPILKSDMTELNKVIHEAKNGGEDIAYVEYTPTESKGKKSKMGPINLEGMKPKQTQRTSGSSQRRGGKAVKTPEFIQLVDANSGSTSPIEKGIANAIMSNRRNTILGLK